MNILRIIKQMEDRVVKHIDSRFDKLESELGGSKKEPELDLKIETKKTKK